MIGAIVLFLLGIGCFVISSYFKSHLSFEGNAADYVLCGGARCASFCRQVSLP